MVIRDDRDLHFDEPESCAMKYFASVSLLSGLGESSRLGESREDIEFSS